MAKKSTLIIQGDNRGALTAINQTTSKLGMAVGQVQGMGNGLTGAMSGFTGILTRLPMMASMAAIGIVVGFAAMIKKSIDLADSFDKMSQKAGVSVEFLSTMKFAVDLGGASIEQLEKGIKTLSRNLYDFSKGAGQTVKYALEDLRIAATNANGSLKNTEDIIYEVADSFAKMQDGSKKTALAMSLFGKAGADLIPTLNQGSEALKEQQEQARKLGLEISTKTASQAAEFNDNLEILKYSMTGLANTVAESLLPQLASLTGGLVKLSSNSQSLTPVLIAMSQVFKVLITFFGGIATGAYVAGQSLGIFYATAAKVITLQWGDIPYVFEKGFKNIKDFSLTAGSIFKALWSEGENVNDILKKIKEQADMDSATESAKQLAKEWESLNKTLSGDIAKSTLPEIAYQIYQIDQRFSEYAAKFPGHIVMINKWRDAMVKGISIETQKKALTKIQELEIGNIIDTNAQKEALNQKSYEKELSEWKQLLDSKILSQLDYDNLIKGLDLKRETEIKQNAILTYNENKTLLDILDKLHISTYTDINAQKEVLIQEGYNRELSQLDKFLNDKLISEQNYNELLNQLNLKKEIAPTQLIDETIAFNKEKYDVQKEALIAIKDLEISNIFDTNAQKEDLIQEGYSRELAYWDKMLLDKYISQEDYDKLFKGLDEKREMESTQLQLANQALREQALSVSLGNMSDAFMMFSNMSKTQNKAMFAVSKAFAIAEAGIQTYLGATKALAMVELFPFNFVLAGSIIAQGLANVARIASMQPGSVASGGSVSAPSASTSPTGGGISDNRQISYTINFYGGGFDGDKDRLARDLIDSINKAQEDGLILVGA